MPPPHLHLHYRHSCRLPSLTMLYLLCDVDGVWWWYKSIKLSLNQIVASQASSIAWAIAYLERVGVDLDKFMETLKAAPFHSPYFDLKAPAIRSRQFYPAAFTSILMSKDMELAQSEAKRVGIRSDTLDAARELLAVTNAAGYGDHDFAAMVHAIAAPKEGVDVKTPPLCKILIHCSSQDTSNHGHPVEN
jgi:hypothetical protein